MRNQCAICFFLLAIFISCKRKTVFQAIPSDQSGIHFNNEIVENDSINPIDMINIYNGGGVGIGDFNKDGLQDIYFAGNTVSNKLYLNKGNFVFEDITDAAVAAGSFFSTGHLYRNEWNDSLKHPVFRDVSKEAGITIEGFGHAATIADIDGDGWKDIYVTNDFIGDDILYINNHDGTFTDKAKSY